MKLSMKKTFSLLLALTLVLSMHVWTAPPARAAGWSGQGLVTDPYLIGTPAELAELSARVKAGETFAETCFELTADISLQGFGTGAGWTPIGTGMGTIAVPGTPFQGALDGRFFTVSDLFINASGSLDMGLFGYLGKHGILSNIGVSVAAAGLTTTQDSDIGALAGYSEGLIENCFSTGGAIASSSSSGGLVGHNLGEIRSCFSTNNVSGYYDVGGLVGSAGGTISNCYATGDVTSYTGYFSAAGGLAGTTYGEDVVKNCYAVGGVLGGDIVNALAGLGRMVPGSYWNRSSAQIERDLPKAVKRGDERDVCVGLDTAQMVGPTDKTNMTAFDFTSVWVSRPPDGIDHYYPQLAVFAVTAPAAVRAVSLESVKVQITTGGPITFLKIDGPIIKEFRRGYQLQLTVTTIPADIDPSLLEWTTNKPRVATVSDTGLVTGLEAGVVMITVRTRDGSNLSDSNVLCINYYKYW